MKTDKIKIEQDLNRYIWRKGKTNPPRTVRVRMIREDDVVIVSSFTEPRIVEVKDQGSEISKGKDPE
jgi:large subunit ribosomal protein L31e